MSANGMVFCRGCGFNVERAHVLDWGGPTCLSCARCSAHCTPDVREAYRRGYNAGIDEMARVVTSTTENHRSLHKRREEEAERLTPAEKEKP